MSIHYMQIQEKECIHLILLVFIKPFLSTGDILNLLIVSLFTKNYRELIFF